MRGPIDAACRQCAEVGHGGPADYRYTIFDAVCPECRGQGQPQIFVNTGTLGLYLRSVDLVLAGGALTLERSYNLGDTQSGPFGPGWTFNLNESAAPDAGRNVWTWRRGTGRTDRFSPAIEAGRFFALTRTAETLAAGPDGTLRIGNRVFGADGRLLSLERQGRRVTLEYDAAGRLAFARSAGCFLEFRHEGDRIVSVADSAGRTVRYTYTAEGRLSVQLNADGEWVAYEYDDAGRLSSVRLPAGTFAIAWHDDPEYPAVASIALPGGAVRRYEPGPLPRQVLVTADESAGATAYGYDALGLVESVTDPAGNRTTCAYDAAGRRTRVTNANGETTRFEYDAAARLSAVIDAAGNRWTAEYDASGKPVRIADPNQNAWAFRYDAAGRMEAFADPLGFVVNARYGAGGQLAALVDAAGNQSAFEYDAAGRLARRIGPLGDSWSYRYDKPGRLAAVVNPAGAGFAIEYDAANRAVAASAGETRALLAPSVTRDALNRIVASVDSFGNALGYAYDAVGRLSELRLPAGTVRYEYDRAGRLSRVSDWAGNFALYRYDAAGAVTSLSVSGGPVTAWQYDAARNLRALISTGAGGDVVAAYRYVRDAAGNRTAVSAVEPYSSPLEIAGAKAVFDAANRVVERDDGYRFHYDAAGNLAAIEGPRSAELSWDPFGRLERFHSEEETLYRYDASGLRVERRTPGSVRRFVYDLSAPSPRMVMETDGDGAVVASYIYGHGLLWKVDASGRPWFYHFDGDGNTVAVSTSESGVVNRYRYDPLGRLAAAEEGTENPFRMGGERGWVDDGNGLIYGEGVYRHPQLRLALPGAIALAPPEPALAPRLPGAASCFLEGPWACGLGERNGR